MAAYHLTQDYDLLQIILKQVFLQILRMSCVVI